MVKRRKYKNQRRKKINGKKNKRKRIINKKIRSRK
jgi:hypothetical protein